MMHTDSFQLGVQLLNTILEMDNVDMEVHGRVLNALVLIDPQPEEDQFFYDALNYASTIVRQATNEIEQVINDAEKGN